jgi:hypothetical protein
MKPFFVDKLIFLHEERGVCIGVSVEGDEGFLG